MNSEQGPVTARALAHQALDDESLFDSLVARGAVDSSLRDPAFRAILAARQRRKYWPMAIAAAAGLLAFLVLRPTSPEVQQPARQARVIPSVLLPDELKAAVPPDAPIFRGAGAPSRAPQSDGVITSVEDGIAILNLGSIDGLTTGVQLPLEQGKITITTVFRDHSRGTVAAAATIHANQPVRLPISLHLTAILQQVDALAASGKLKSARDVASAAVAAGPPGETRQLLERLAALDYQAGATGMARQHFEVVVNNFDQAPAATSAERARTLASYGAISLLAGDQQRAQDLLQKALSLAADPTLRSQIVNNLAFANRR